MGVLGRPLETLAPYVCGHAAVSGAPIEFNELSEHGCAVAMPRYLLPRPADVPAILGEHWRELARVHEFSMDTEGN